MNRNDLKKKAAQAATALIQEKGYISFIDLFIRLKYLTIKDYTDWRLKRVSCLEKVISVNLGKINFIMKETRRNSVRGKPKQSYTEYKSWGKGRKIPLRFSKSGDRNIEKLYATHFVLPKNLKKKATSSHPETENVNCREKATRRETNGSSGGRLANPNS